VTNDGIGNRFKTHVHRTERWNIRNSMLQYWCTVKSINR